MTPLTDGERQFAATLFPHGKPVTELELGPGLLGAAAILLAKLDMPYEVVQNKPQVILKLR